MKKLICCILALILIFGISFAAYAAEATSCVISADSVSAAAGGTVTVPIRITDHEGFTNFEIKLDYDRDALTLVSIDNCAGDVVSTNIAWEDGEGNICGYAVSAASEAVTGDGILFEATFEASEDFSGTAEVVPVVGYVRNNSALFSVFENVTAQINTGEITAVAMGDVNGDGKVTTADALLVYKASIGEYTMTEAQEIIADSNGDGKVTTADALLIYKAVLGG